MARLGSLTVLFLILFASLCSCLEGRKLHVGADKHSKKVDPSSRNSLFLSSLPKGTVPSSTPSRKGHSTEVDEKLIARHLISTERHLTQSVPSPGAGH
ncbi:precursor of CEP14-like [Abrus precatorius]|uniref:Precursor of CEP14-like n=1 Tax=Abrus precatorius TaxID=3816 RepID=A0A8B8K8V3_ABRPR|nr:precursor of CEP14-like [Abrus precatorius]